MEACCQPHTPEPSCHPNAVQNGDQSVGPPCVTEGRLDGLHRSEERLPSDPGPSRFSPISLFCGVRGVVPIQGALFRSFHTGHGSSFRDASSSRDPDAPIPRRLASPRIFSDRCSVGEGRNPLSLSGPWDCHQSPQVSSGSDPVCHPSGDVPCISDFEGFPLSGEGFRPSDSDRRISVLQAAKRRLLVQSARPLIVSLPASPRWLSSDAASPTRSPLRMEYRR